MQTETVQKRVSRAYDGRVADVRVESIDKVTDGSSDTLTEILLTVPHTRAYESVEPHDAYIEPLIPTYVELVAGNAIRSSIEVMICSRHDERPKYILGGLGSFRVAKEWAESCSNGRISVTEIAAFALNTYVSAPVEDAGLPWIPEYAGAIGWIPEYESDWTKATTKWHDECHTDTNSRESFDLPEPLEH